MTSTLKVDNINTTNDRTLYENGYRTGGWAPGEIVQKKVVRSDAPVYITIAGAGTAIPQLRLTITPKFSNSLLFIQWTIFGEPEVHNTSFRVFLNGSLDSTTGYEGYNGNSEIDAGQYRVVAMATPYETNYSSTPYQNTVNHITSVASLGGIQEYFFEPAAYENGNAGHFHLNTSGDLTTDGAYENGVSFGYIEEIAQ